MTETWEKLGETEAFAGIAEVMRRLPADIEPDIAMREAWGKLAAASREAMSSGLAYAATFRPLLAPCTADIEYRPLPHARIARNADIVLHEEDRPKLNGFMTAHFVLSEMVESPVAGRERYTARLIPPYPIHAPFSAVESARHMYARRRSTALTAALEKSLGHVGIFDVIKDEELSNGAIVISQGQVSGKTGKKAIYVMKATDYDFVQLNNSTPYLLNISGSKVSTVPTSWLEDRSLKAYPVDAYKGSSMKTTSGKRYKLQVVEV